MQFSALMSSISFSQQLVFSVSKGTFRTVQNEVPPPQIDSHRDRPIFDLIAVSVFEDGLEPTGVKELYSVCKLSLGSHTILFNLMS